MPRAETSALLTKRWRIPESGDVQLVRPAKMGLEQLDEEWSGSREPGDVSEGWAWASAWGSPDLFVLRDENREALAVWRSSKPLVTFDKQRFYRLDNIEVAPLMRGVSVGRFMMALVASRASELLPTAGILLAAPPARVRWYLRIGGRSASSLGWKYPAGLEPLMFEPPAVHSMKEMARALEIEK